MKITIEQPDLCEDGEMTHVTVEYRDAVYELDTRAHACFSLESVPRQPPTIGSIRDQPIWGPPQFEVRVTLSGRADPSSVCVRQSPPPAEQPDD